MTIGRTGAKMSKEDIAANRYDAAHGGGWKKGKSSWQGQSRTTAWTPPGWQDKSTTWRGGSKYKTQKNTKKELTEAADTAAVEAG